MKKTIENLNPEATGNTLTDFFQSPTFQALTIGVPFCIFKLLFGLLAIRTNLIALSYLIVFWASIDLLMNIGRIIYDQADLTSPIEYCIIAQAGRIVHRPRLFLAIDTLLSFGIICLVLWSGWIKLLHLSESYLWYAATTLNLMGIAVVNIWLEYERRA
jgi:hypothetical protein